MRQGKGRCLFFFQHGLFKLNTYSLTEDNMLASNINFQHSQSWNTIKAVCIDPSMFGLFIQYML